MRSAQNEESTATLAQAQDASTCESPEAERAARTEQSDARREKSDREQQREARDALLRDHMAEHAEHGHERDVGGREV